MSDPDGIQWEVYYFHADAEFNDPHFEEPAAACCMAPAEEKKSAFKNFAVEEAACCTPGSGCC